MTPYEAKQRRLKAADARRALRGHRFGCDCATCTREREEASREFVNRKRKSEKQS